MWTHQKTVDEMGTLEVLRGQKKEDQSQEVLRQSLKEIERSWEKPSTWGTKFSLGEGARRSQQYLGLFSAELQPLLDWVLWDEMGKALQPGAYLWPELTESTDRQTALPRQADTHRVSSNQLCEEQCPGKIFPADRSATFPACGSETSMGIPVCVSHTTGSPMWTFTGLQSTERKQGKFLNT